MRIQFKWKKLKKEMFEAIFFTYTSDHRYQQYNIIVKPIVTLLCSESKICL